MSPTAFAAYIKEIEVQRDWLAARAAAYAGENAEIQERVAALEEAKEPTDGAPKTNSD